MKKIIFTFLLSCLIQLAISQGTWTNFTPDNSGILSTVRAMETDHLNRIWIGYEWSAPGLTIFDGSTWLTIDTSNGLSDNKVHVIFEDRNNNMWIGTENGLCKYNGNDWTIFTTIDDLIYNYVISIFEDASNNLWFGTVNGLSKFDGSNWTNYSISDGLADNYIYAITQDKQGNMWFSYGLSASGVTKFNGLNWTTYTINNGLISNQVNTILCDHIGNLWFGCYGFDAGISMFNGISWTSYPSGSGPACNNVWSSLKDSQNRLWFGTSCHGGTSLYDFSNWTIYDTTNSGIISNNILEIKEDTSGNIWLGGYDGLSKFSFPTRITEIEHISFINIFPNPNNGKFSISLKNIAADTKVEIYNITAEKVYSSVNAQLNKAIIDLSILSKGIYFVKIYDGETSPTGRQEIYTEKIVMQ